MPPNRARDGNWWNSLNLAVCNLSFGDQSIHRAKPAVWEHWSRIWGRNFLAKSYVKICGAQKNARVLMRSALTGGLEIWNSIDWNWAVIECRLTVGTYRKSSLTELWELKMIWNNFTQAADALNFTFMAWCLHARCWCNIWKAFASVAQWYNTVLT